MSRPFKCRWISGRPEFTYFKPAGVPLSQLEEITLTLDEYEAVRLAHLENLYHEEAAERMKISRQTFGNILNSAHQKITDTIVNGKSIKIEGGVYQMDGMRTFRCSDCKNEWQVEFGTGRPPACPQCAGKNLHRVPGERGFGRPQAAGRGRRRGRSS